MAAVKVTPEMAKRAVAEIDWAALDAMSDDEIARQIARNPDAAPDLTLPRVRVVLRLASSRLAPRHKLRLVRRALGMSQSQFASAYHFNLRTLQNWERGAGQPDEATLAYLRVIAHMPEEARRALSA
jgi:putative transcriptional regulator